MNGRVRDGRDGRSPQAQRQRRSGTGRHGGTGSAHDRSLSNIGGSATGSFSYKRLNRKRKSKAPSGFGFADRFILQRSHITSGSAIESIVAARSGVC